jgi:hypothetical protein
MPERNPAFSEKSVSLGPARARLQGMLPRPTLNNRIVHAAIRAVIEYIDGLRLQVDFGNEQTALIHSWQVVKDWAG